MTERERVVSELPLVDTTGRNKAAEPSDPYIATAVSLSTPGYDGLAAMARTFVEEFALMGWPRERIAKMFTIPRFAAAHAVYTQQGPAFVERLIDEVLGPRPDGASRGES